MIGDVYSMLIKVLIADDEWIIRDGLVNFPWKDYGCEVVAEAEDGDEALQMAKVYQPDIILSDIKMPGLNGLSFIKAAKKHCLSAKVIIITGYDDFEFAQKAIKLGVYEYLLKPISFEKLHIVITELSRKIACENQENTIINNIKNQYNLAKPLLRDKLASDLLHGRIGSQIDELLKTFDISIEKHVVVVGNLNRDKNESCINIEPWLIEYGIYNLEKEIFLKFARDVLVETENYKYTSILLFPKTLSDEECISATAFACKKLQEAVMTFVGLEMCFGISGVGSDPSKITSLRKHANDASFQGCFFSNSEIVFYNDLYQDSIDDFVISSSQKEFIIYAISAGKYDDIKKGIDDIFLSKVAVNSGINEIKNAALSFLIEIISIHSSNECAFSYSQYKEIDVVNSMIVKSIKLEQLINDIYEYLVEITKEKLKTKTNHYDRIVEDIYAYIHQHYSEDISLDSISEVFCLSSSYISRLLGSYGDKSFSEYLTYIRLNEAKRLLVDNQHKIYDIAKLVGYNDYSYFISVFKKQFGVTPNKFRKGT